MIDTPGHVDLSSEVSTAARLVDGALVLVDAVEGVSSQTISVLRQAWDDRLKPILVVNKIDRLATELRMSPIEAYHHLAQLLEAANAVMGSFFAAERMEDDLRWREAREQRSTRAAHSLANAASAPYARIDAANGASAPCRNKTVAHAGRRERRRTERGLARARRSSRA